jgi:Restriction endonuclease
MSEMGYKRVRQLGGSGGLGVDLTARDPDGRTVAVQCKKVGQRRHGRQPRPTALHRDDDHAPPHRPRDLRLDRLGAARGLM